MLTGLVLWKYNMFYISVLFFIVHLLCLKLYQIIKNDAIANIVFFISTIRRLYFDNPSSLIKNSTLETLAITGLQESIGPP